MRGIDEVALAFDRACASAGVGYAYMGAFAVMSWGEPRATTDVDALVTLAEEQVDAFVAALAREALNVDARDLRDAMRDRSHVTVFHAESPFYVDVKLARTPRELAQVREGARVPIRGQELSVVRPEETIAFKLAFGSPKDIQDALSIVHRQGPRLDRARLASLASELRVVRQLDALLADAAREEATFRNSDANNPDELPR